MMKDETEWVKRLEAVRQRLRECLKEIEQLQWEISAEMARREAKK